MSEPQGDVETVEYWWRLCQGMEQQLTAAQARIAELEATIARVRALPLTWRSDAADHDDPETDRDWVQVHNGCADELEAGLAGDGEKRGG